MREADVPSCLRKGPGTVPEAHSSDPGNELQENGTKNLLSNRTLSVGLTVRTKAGVAIPLSIRRKRLADLMRELVYDFLDQFSLSTFTLWTTKTRAVVLPIKELTALGHVTFAMLSVS